MAGRDLFYAVYDDLFTGKDYAAEARTTVLLGTGTSDPGPLKILDIGAGTGGHSIACARLGHEVTAVEIDPRMAERFKMNVENEEPKIRERISLHAVPVEKLDGSGYDLAMAMFNVVNYLPSIESALSFMGAVAERIRPGCGFVFDAWNGKAAVSDPPQGKETRVETDAHLITVQLTADMDIAAAETLLTYDIEKKAKAGADRETGSYSMKHYLWTPDQLVAGAGSAGFASVAVHPLDDHTRAATDEDWKVIFHCIKSK